MQPELPYLDPACPGATLYPPDVSICPRHVGVYLYRMQDDIVDSRAPVVACLDNSSDNDSEGDELIRRPQSQCKP